MSDTTAAPPRLCALCGQPEHGTAACQEQLRAHLWETHWPHIAMPPQREASHA